MKTQYGNLWNIESDYKIITTNGFLKKNGAAVMGRGIALQAKQRFPGLELDIGESIRVYGNHARVISHALGIIIFPTKHNWWDSSSLRLIEQSAKSLRQLVLDFSESVFVMPVPGIGNGHLSLEEVLPILFKVEFPDNVILAINDYELLEKVKNLEKLSII